MGNRKYYITREDWCFIKNKEEAEAIVYAAIAQSYELPLNNQQQNPSQIISP